jgi:hypothetical protein
MSTTIQAEASDHWRGWGLNVIPADTKKRKLLVSWLEWEHNPIPIELHNAWKIKIAFSKGLAIVTGRIWHLKDSKGLNIDFEIDNRYPKPKKPKLYFCDRFGDIIS